MRISDWSSDVCSSDLLLQQVTVDLVRIAFAFGRRSSGHTHGRGRGGKRFLEVNEKLQLVLQDASGISNRIFGSHGPVSLKSQRQLVLVQFLPDAGIFNLVGDLLDRGKQRVDRAQANGCVSWAVGDGRNIDRRSVV